MYDDTIMGVGIDGESLVKVKDICSVVWADGEGGSEDNSFVKIGAIVGAQISGDVNVTNIDNHGGYVSPYVGAEFQLGEDWTLKLQGTPIGLGFVQGVTSSAPSSRIAGSDITANGWLGGLFGEKDSVPESNVDKETTFYNNPDFHVSATYKPWFNTTVLAGASSRSILYVGAGITPEISDNVSIPLQCTVGINATVSCSVGAEYRFSLFNKKEDKK